MKNNITINIAGIELRLLAEESQEHYTRLEGIINEYIGKMMHDNPKCTISEAIICASLEYLNRKNAAERRVDILEQQLKQLNYAITKLISENEQLRKLNDI